MTEKPGWPRRRGRGIDPIRWRLHIARLASFLRRARQLRDLADDAKEKYQEDYVFDRHYVSSLTDSSLERLEELLFDAQVMAGWDDALEQRFRACHAQAETLYSGAVTPLDDDAPGEPLKNEPEYRLLAAFSRWIDGGPKAADPSVMALVHKAVGSVFTAVRDDRSLAAGRGLASLEVTQSEAVIEIADLGGGVEQQDGKVASVRHVHCEPLILMLLGAGDEGTEPSTLSGGAPSSLAVVDRQHLSFRQVSGDSTVFLETTFTGRHRSNWLFLYQGGDLASMFEPPAGTRAEPTAGGRVLWFDGPPARMDRTLSNLGAELIGRRGVPTTR